MTNESGSLDYAPSGRFARDDKEQRGRVARDDNSSGKLRAGLSARAGKGRWGRCGSPSTSSGRALRSAAEAAAPVGMTNESGSRDLLGSQIRKGQVLPVRTKCRSLDYAPSGRFARDDKFAEEIRRRRSPPYRQRKAIRVGHPHTQIHFCSTQTPSFWPSVVNSVIQSLDAASFCWTKTG